MGLAEEQDRDNWWSEICLIRLWGNGGSHKALYRKKMDVLTQNWQHFWLKYKSVGENKNIGFCSRPRARDHYDHLALHLRRPHRAEASVRSLLVIQDDVRSPDVVSWDVEALDSAVLLRIPHQLVIPPELLNPQIGCHNLVLQVLKVARKEKRWLTSNFDKSF